MKQLKNPQKIGEQETEQKENIITKEQDYNQRTYKIISNKE